MEDLSPRLQDILSLAREQGRVGVDDLALRFSVTPQTIRKDLNDLCERRLLKRVHGGAVVASTVENLRYDARRMLAASEKARIGRHAAGLIPNDCSLFINIGTTTEEVARRVGRPSGLDGDYQQHQCRQYCSCHAGDRNHRGGRDVASCRWRHRGGKRDRFHQPVQGRLRHHRRVRHRGGRGVAGFPTIARSASPKPSSPMRERWCWWPII